MRPIVVIAEATVIEGPSFEDRDTEGHPVSNYSIFVVVETTKGYYTHRHSFRAWESTDAEDLAARVSARRHIDGDYWEEGTPWDAYRTPLSYEEEKMDALNFEATPDWYGGYRG